MINLKFIDFIYYDFNRIKAEAKFYDPPVAGFEFTHFLQQQGATQREEQFTLYY